METLKPKLFEAMKNYSKKQLFKDIISGIIVAIIALPLSIALAIDSKKYTKVIVIRMRSVPAMDANVMRSLNALADRADRKGIQLVFSHVNEQPLSVMKKDGFYERLGSDHFQQDIVSALEYAEGLLK